MYSVLGTALSSGALTSLLSAADAEPSRFAPDAYAQPIVASVSDATPAAESSDSTLRWKTARNPVSSTSSQSGGRVILNSVEETASSPAASGSSWNKTRIDGQVRLAQHTTDPFNDPFGDKSGRGAPAELVLEPTPAESGGAAAYTASNVETLPAPRPQSIRPIPSPAHAHIEPDFVAQPGATQPERNPLGTPPAIEALGPMDEGPMIPGSPCKRIYNDRNCCDIETGCQAFREQLRNESIRNISLDITPRFMPNLNIDEDTATRAERFRLLEIRPWKNKLGQTLATGRLSNMLNGRVIVVDEAGQEQGKIPWEQLGDDELCYVNAFWHLPAECALGGRDTVTRNWLASSYAWHASALCHKPLYFEEPQLERYGHTLGPHCQPFLSGAHFFLNLATLPYHMAYQPVHECQYPLGYYRPGNCAPWMIPPCPISIRGALAEAGCVVGGVYILP